VEVSSTLLLKITYNFFYLNVLMAVNVLDEAFPKISKINFSCALI